MGPLRGRAPLGGPDAQSPEAAACFEAGNQLNGISSSSCTGNGNKAKTRAADSWALLVSKLNAACSTSAPQQVWYYEQTRFERGPCKTCAGGVPS